MDTIRLIAALVVVLTHVPLLPLSLADGPAGLLKALELGQRALLNGHAAVMVFFLVSGFVIHLPFAGAERVPLAEFWSRRLLRICLPLFAVSLISAVASFESFPLFWEVGFQMKPVGPRQGWVFDTLVLWSLFAEIVYYTIYPAVHRLSHKFGWGTVCLASYLLSWSIVAWQPEARVPGNFTNWLCWAVAMPPWLVGCWLANVHAAKGTCQPAITLWRARALLVLASLMTKMLSSPPFPGWPTITYSWTLPLFGAVAAFWLQAEIRHFQNQSPPRMLELLGRATYSVYLVHIPAQDLAYRLLANDFMMRNPILTQGFSLCLVLILAWLAYRLIELPSWNLAKAVSRRFANKSEPA